MLIKATLLFYNNYACLSLLTPGITESNSLEPLPSFSCCNSLLKSTKTGVTLRLHLLPSTWNLSLKLAPSRMSDFELLNCVELASSSVAIALVQCTMSLPGRLAWSTHSQKPIKWISTAKHRGVYLVLARGFGSHAQQSQTATNGYV